MFRRTPLLYAALLGLLLTTGCGTTQTSATLGATGATGATGPAGPAGLTFLNAWNPATNYLYSNVVTYQGSSFFALQPSLNVAPGSLTNAASVADWAVLAAAGANGAAGSTGTTGAQGAQGFAGLQGPPGITGPAGTPGLAGLQGPQGPQGTTGAAGAVGTAGLPGPAGPAGVPGSIGPAGLTGSAGVAGPTGPAGGVGATGATGVAGAAGPQGIVGPQGIAGPPGLAGPTGAQGVAGSQGLPGVAGATGTPGLMGLTGATGAVGPAGALGLTGIAGPAGPIGLPGATGLAGATGPQGITGLPGATGATGLTGAAGPAGPTGSPGATGATGAAGPQGTPGTLAGSYLKDLKLGVQGDSISAQFNNAWQNVVTSRTGMTLAYQDARRARRFDQAFECWGNPPVGSQPGAFNASYVFPSSNTGEFGDCSDRAFIGVAQGTNFAASLAALDILVIELGTNDQIVPLGQLGDAANSGTFYGNMRWVVETYLNAKPTLRVVLVTTQYNGFFSPPTDAGRYAAATEAFGNSVGVPVINMYKLGGVNANTVSVLTNNSDTVHPSPFAFSKVYGPVIAQALQQIF